MHQFSGCLTQLCTGNEVCFPFFFVFGSDFHVFPSLSTIPLTLCVIKT